MLCRWVLSLSLSLLLSLSFSEGGGEGGRDGRREGGDPGEPGRESAVNCAEGARVYRVMICTNETVLNTQQMARLLCCAAVLHGDVVVTECVEDLLRSAWMASLARGSPPLELVEHRVDCLPSVHVTPSMRAWEVALGARGSPSFENGWPRDPRVACGQFSTISPT